jgi:hypothetical protein
MTSNAAVPLPTTQLTTPARRRTNSQVRPHALPARYGPRAFNLMQRERIPGGVHTAEDTNHHIVLRCVGGIPADTINIHS